jgi:Zn-dependent peptidase ImmA (M78 family)
MNVALRGDDWGAGGTRKQRAQARAWIEEFRPILFLQLYAVYVFHETTDNADDSRCNAQTRITDEGYQSFTVYIFPKFWDALTTDDERRFYLLHELCHVITAKTRSLAFEILNEKLVRASEITRANEYATDWIARIVMSLLAK